MKNIAYRAIYVTLVGLFVFALIGVLFVGGASTSSGGRAVALYAVQDGNILPGLVLGFRDVSLEQGQTAVASPEGVYAIAGPVMASTRVQGTLMYAVGNESTLYAAQLASYRQVLYLPFAGALVTVTTSLWALLILLGVPVVMFVTHLTLSILIRHQKALRRATTHPRVVQGVPTMSQVARAPHSRQEDYYEEERDGVTELDTLVRPRQWSPAAGAQRPRFA